MRYKLLSVLFFLFSLNSYAQSGVISGKVIDSVSGQPLANATVILIEKSKTVIADQSGKFSFTKITEGTYSLRCSYTGYREKEVSDIVVDNKAGGEVNIVVSLSEKKALDAVTLSSKSSARRETVASLLVAQKNYAGVSDGITAETIKRTPDRGSSDVIKRVSGASIQDDRFAIIRGLNDRYNAAFINGAPLPSTESDRKAFAFDIFPAAILDNLIIYKTATPDKSGDFAGGMIDITTKSTLSKGFTTVSYSMAYNSSITGSDRFFSDNKGRKDWIGIDDGTRGIPAGIPSTEALRAMSPAQTGDLAKLFGNYRWGVQKQKAKPEYNFQLTKGFNILRRQSEFIGALFSVNYKRAYTLVSGERNAVSPRGAYRDSVYNDEVVVSALANFSVKINSRNIIGWRNNLSINTDNKLVRRTGVYDLDSDPDTYVRDILRWYTSNRIFSSQLNGEHQVGKIKTKINWLGGVTSVKRDIPEFTRTSYNGTVSSRGQAFINNNPTQLTGSGTMFFASTSESIKSIKADVTQPYKFMKNSQNFFKAGAGFQVRERDFSSRLLGFAPYDIGAVQHDYSLNELPEDQIFLPANLGILKNGKGGFLLRDGTTPNPDYDAKAATLHAYLMNDQRFFSKFRLIYGVRMEQFDQQINSPSGSALVPASKIDSVVTDFLPSANFVYSLTSKMNIRLSYTETVNRPEFRELAPFLFYDYQAQYSINGDLRLQRAKIRNYDFRYEFFPGRAQLFSVSAFYKQFLKPIEIIFIPGVGLGGGQATYANSETAEVYGVEAEIRALLSTIAGIKNEKHFLNRFTLTANGAYMKSKVNLPFVSGTGSVSRIAAERPMQGQSPYIVNGSFGYNSSSGDMSATLSVNRIGDRLAIAGVKNEVFDVYEKARTVVDFQVSRSFYKGAVELKFNCRDLLSQNLIFYYDNDYSKSLNDGDIYFSSYKLPKVFTLSVTCKL